MVVEADVLHAVAGLERFVQDVAVAQVAHFGADGGVAAAGFVVGVLDHLEQPAVELEGHSLAEVINVDHCLLPFLV